MNNVRNSTASVAPADEAESFPTRFELGSDERTADGLRRIVLEQVDLALWHAQRVGGADEHVHGVRRTTKRLRAVLRLVRDDIGEDSYRHNNKVLRDVARKLSAVRSATVRVETLEALTERLGPPAESVDEMHDELVANADRMRSGVLGDLRPTVDLVSPLERTRVSLKAWTLPPVLVPTTLGLERTYHRGRLSMELAYSDGSTECFHEWRKQVKYLRHQMEVLAVAQPETTPAIAASLEELGDGLGFDHDLADLGSALGRMPVVSESLVQRGGLVDAIAQRRRELQADLHPLGERLYAQTPKTFVRDVTTCWEEQVG